jgi:hypothetical protein
MQQYEYKFVRLATHDDWLTGERLSSSTLSGYQEVVQHHASEGWRLVQIFAPGIGTSGQPPYFELILERQTASSGAPDSK